MNKRTFNCLATGLLIGLGCFSGASPVVGEAQALTAQERECAKALSKLVLKAKVKMSIEVRKFETEVRDRVLAFQFEALTSWHNGDCRGRLDTPLAQAITDVGWFEGEYGVHIGRLGTDNVAAIDSIVATASSEIARTACTGASAGSAIDSLRNAQDSIMQEMRIVALDGWNALNDIKSDVGAGMRPCPVY